MSSIFNDKFKKVVEKKEMTAAAATVASGVAKCPSCEKIFSPGTEVCDVDGTLITIVKPSEDALVGQTLGGAYEILSVLGKGGMAVVYKARHKLMDRIVAVKMLLGNMETDPEKVIRFQQEARAASSLNHPNLITLYDFGIAPDGRAYLVMDYLEGKSLSQILETSEVLPVHRVIRIFRQVCDSLEHAHQKGIVHRDLKPSNIILVNTEDGTDLAKVVDFGIAKILDTASKAQLQATMNGQLFGSPMYMSPEQCMSKPITTATDIYCLGTTMYECLVGVPPCKGESITEIITKQVTQKAERLSNVRPDLKFPSELEAVLEKMLAKNPEHRYKSMAQVKEALDSVPATHEATKRTVVTAGDTNKVVKRIVIVEENEELLQAMAGALGSNSKFQVVGMAINGEMALQRVEQLRPDIVVMALQLPVMNGLDASNFMLLKYPSLRVVALGSPDKDQHVLAAFRAGAFGFLRRVATPDALLSAVQTVAAGDPFLDQGVNPTIAKACSDVVRTTLAKQKAAVSGAFSVVEFDILKLLAEGWSEEEIAGRLQMSVEQLFSHRLNIIKTLNELSQ